MVKPRQPFHPLHRRGQTIEECFLGGFFHDPVRLRHEQQCRLGDGARVGHQSRGSIKQVKQDVHRDLAENHRVGLVGGGLLRVMRQHFGFDITFDITVAENSLFQSQQRHGKRKVEFYAECRHAQDQAANRRRIIMHPCRNRDGTDAMRHHDHVFDGDLVLRRNMPHECLHVADDDAQVFRRAAFAGRVSVTARVPRKYSNIIKAQRRHGFLPARGMFVATMKQQQRLVRRLFRKPRAVK